VILIDTSAWIEYLRDGDATVADEVERLLADGACVSEPILMEVLAGARSSRHEAQLRGLLGNATTLPVDAEDWADAALLYRLCRINGATVRSMIDCLVAAVGIRHDVAVLAHDRDFVALAAHTPLRLAG
jgi:predicted nucleic acid-binding protein